MVAVHRKDPQGALPHLPRKPRHIGMIRKAILSQLLNACFVRGERGEINYPSEVSQHCLGFAS